MKRWSLSILVFVVGVALASGVSIAFAGSWAPVLSMVLSLPVGVFTYHTYDTLSDD